MQWTLLFGLVLLAVFVNAEEEFKDDSGIYFDGAEVALACTIGSPVNAKLINAFGECYGNRTEEEPVEAEKPMKKCPSGRKGKKCREKQRKKACPTVKKIKAMTTEKMKDHICIMEEMGWIDSEGNEIVEVMKADIASLPVEINANLTDEIIGNCSIEMVTMWSEDPKHKKCGKKLNQDDLAELTEFGLKMASYKCFHSMFSSACKEQVKNQIYELYAELAFLAAMNQTAPEIIAEPEVFPEYPEPEIFPEPEVFPENPEPEIIPEPEVFPEYPEPEIFPEPETTSEYPELFQNFTDYETLPVAVASPLPMTLP